jgi:hypothetical protein
MRLLAQDFTFSTGNCYNVQLVGLAGCLAPRPACHFDFHAEPIDIG